MNSGVVFDTTVLIDHLRGFTPAKEKIELVKQKSLLGYISVLTEAELLAGQGSKNSSKRKEIIELISIFQKIILNNEIAQKAGEFKREYNQSLDDCIIAATAFHQNCKLWTKNKKDFEKIKEIEVEDPY